MSQQAVERAMHAWLSNGTGLLALRSEQEENPPQPGTDYTTFLVTLRTGDGTRDVVTREPAPAPAPGQEILVTHSGRRLYTVSLQAFTAKTGGDTSASALLQRLKDRLPLRETQALLDGFGVAVLTMGPVRTLNGLAAVKWRGRAALEVVVNVVHAVTELDTYIETTGVSVNGG